MYRNTYVKIDLNQIGENVKSILSNYPSYQYYIGVVKGNVYGHGPYTVKTMIENGINYLAVSSLEEALAIRKIEPTIPILCLEPIILECIPLCVTYNITITVADISYFQSLEDISFDGILKVHLKLDTGMHRLGIQLKEDVNVIVTRINQSSKFFLEGVYSHFMTPGISDPIWDSQLRKFRLLLSDLDLSKIPIIHMGKSMTLVNHPKIDICNGIRLGILMYGFDQTPRIGKGFFNFLRKVKAQLRIHKYQISKTSLICKASVRPALSYHSYVLQVKQVPKGAFVGYGTSYQASESVRVAVVACGYADGIDLRNSGRMVSINQKRFPIIGVIGMGMLQVVVDGSIKAGDEVVLLGQDISIREVSKQVHTTVYTLMCMIPSHIPRVYIKDGIVEFMDEVKYE